MLLGALAFSSVNAKMVEWLFVKQACSSAPCNTADPSVASLLLKDTPMGVEFLLTPTWNYDGMGNPNSVEALNIVFTNTTPTWTMADFMHLGGVESKDVPLFGSNMDSGYVSPANSLKLKWGSMGGDTFGPGASDDATSSWLIKRTTIDLNFSALATHNAGNPKPNFGIISITGSGRPIGDPPSSNWVTGPSPVPVPAAVWLFGTALVGFIGLSRRRKL